MKKRIFLSLVFSLSISAKIINYETTRLKSTGGAGVASILMDEATISNPAPLAFFNMGAIYFEKSGTETTDLNDNTTELKNYAFIASDSSKNLKGSISYIKADNQDSELKQLNVAFASPMGKKSAAGIAYRNIKKTYAYEGLQYKDEYKQFVPGVFHAVNDNFNVGLVAIDPFRKNPRESKVIVGTQVNIMDYITLMLDGGADYKSELNETAVFKAAAQIKVLNDLYLRFGTYDDKALLEKGTGFGVGWIQPRLVINLAVRNIEVGEDIELRQKEEDIKESSFSLAYRF